LSGLRRAAALASALTLADVLPVVSAGMVAVTTDSAVLFAGAAVAVGDATSIEELFCGATL
jgi:hypothetical protein